ncbi:MAG: 4-(cytidine 5'-diphospho)-2-C-methyl-D-erythritol kinase [Oscillospiraceae bacterium]|nr:4-(cytidine 5'-diphospho)-2-C-methyl-D-erythritol kinase [Oscillospiraceae bacterium]
MSTFYQTTEAFAKINLFLRIVGIRKDGYHQLSTLMQSVSLSDTVSLEMALSGGKSQEVPDIVMSHNVPGLPTDRKNTMYRAAEIFCAHKGLSGASIRIRADKRIPSQAGLGGGSADAAAVLLLLNQGAPEPLTKDALRGVAAIVGADVPFFIDGGAALCEGVGERITHVHPFAGLPVLIAKPGKGVSTPRAYQRYDAKKIPFSPDPFPSGADASVFRTSEAPVSERFAGLRPWLGNDLEETAIDIVPEIEPMLAFLKGVGSGYSAVTGSGSAMFAVFDDRGSRDRAARAFADRFGSNCVLFSCETIEKPR